MSQWAVIYEEPGTRETFQGIPGRLHTPTPRDDAELLSAIKFLLERKRPVHFTIQAIESAQSPRQPPPVQVPLSGRKPAHP